MQVAILDGEPLLLSRRASAARRSITRGRSSGCRCSIQNSRTPRPCDPLGRDAAEVAQPVVRVHGARAEVHFVEREAGELGSRRQARLTGAKRLFGALALGDVDGDAHQPIRLAGGRETGSPARRDPALAALAGRTIRYSTLTGSPALARTARWPPGRDSRSSGWTAASKTLHGDDLVRREPEDRPGPLRDPEDSRRRSPGPRAPRSAESAARLRRSSLSRKASSARLRASALVKTCATSCSRLTTACRPVALRPQRVEADEADGRLAAHGERQAEMRLDAVVAAVLAVDGGLRRELLQRRQRDHAAGQDLLPDPGELLLVQRLGREQTLQGGVGVGGRDDVRGRSPTTARAPRDRGRGARRHCRSASLDGAVHLAGRQVDEPRGEVGDQRLELETAPPRGSAERGVCSVSATSTTVPSPRDPRTSRAARLVVSRGHSPPASH